MAYLRDDAWPGPGARAGRLATARALFETFHRFGPDRLLRRPHPRRTPELLVHLGALRGVIYTARRGPGAPPRSFVHFFDSPPDLACDPGGRQLYVVGGRYRITRRGIEG